MATLLVLRRPSDRLFATLSCVARVRSKRPAPAGLRRRWRWGRHSLLGLAGCAAACAAHGQGTFIHQSDATVNFGPGHIVSGDFNRDGKLDLATLHRGRAEVSLLLGRGDGTMQLATVLVTPAAPLEFYITDFSRDTKPDLVVVGIISALSRGNGAGTFGGFARTELGRDAFTSAIADFNEDGKVDLVTITGAGVQLLTSTGVRVNLAGAATPALAAGASMVSGDFNGDLHQDVVFTRFGQTTSVGVMFGNGDGSFRPLAAFICGEVPIAIVTADFNRDGFPDIASRSLSLTRPISILLNDHSGGFLLPKFPTATRPDFMAVADIDQNGTDDLVLLNRALRRVEMLPNSGDSDATMGASRVLATLPALGPVEIGVADLDQDSFPDLAVSMANATNPNQGQLSIYLNPGTQRSHGVVTTSNHLLMVGGVNAITSFVVEGRPTKVLIRAVGPGLQQLGITRFIANPKFTVSNGTAAIATNDDWSSTTANRTAVEAATQAAGASALTVGSADAAAVLTLDPGAYTINTTPSSTATGEIIIEVYEVPAT